MTVHTHTIPDEANAGRFPHCVCGEFYWTGQLWTRVPDRSLYMDRLDEAAHAVRLGVS